MGLTGERGHCAVCGRDVVLRIPKGGDGSASFPVRHGKPPCDGIHLPCAGTDELQEPAEPKRKRRKTETSSFGVSARESHDASRYYERGLEKITETKDETVNRSPITGELFCHTSEVMHELADNSVALMVTSPSYHVGKEYDLDIGFADFLAMLYRVFAETHRVLEPGGRVAINIANLGRRPYVDFAGYVTEMLREIGFLPRGQILWVKGKGAGGNMAVGSFCSPSNPVLRDLHEYIVVMCKGRYDRAINHRRRAELGLPHLPTMQAQDFLAATLSVWEIRAESAKHVGHPAPFPVELPRRLIELYTWADDLVLDPFIGAGTTAVAAVQTGRRYVGYDLDPQYLDRARERISAALPAPTEEEAS